MNLLPAMALAALVASDDVCSARLDHLLSLYREYELPTPPADATLARVDASRGKYLRVFKRTPEDEKREKFHGYTVTVVKPEPGALADTELIDLDTVIHCHARGWKSLSCAAFRKWLAKAELRAERQLACDAWGHWLNRLGEQAPALPVIAKHLNRILPRTGLADERNLALLRSLELSLVPSKATPGSNEALIDQLIDRGDSGLFDQSEAYKTLPRRGFDAIPALIAHLGDDRLTRYSSRNFIDNQQDFYRVKDVVFRMICDFAGKRLTESNDVAERTLAAGRWFADAQKLGEEEFAVTNVGQREACPWDDVLLPILVEKYPRRLPDAYRRFIEKETQWDHLGAPFADAIVKSAIPLEEKVKVLEFAATHPNSRHRLEGLRHLALVDGKRASELLVAALEKMPGEPNPDIYLARLVGIGLDPKAWETLNRVSWRVTPGVRVGLLAEVFIRWEEPTAAQRQRQIAFAASHLIDTDSWEATGHWQLQSYYLSEPLSQSEVRNYAALKVLWTFGLHVQPHREWSAERWASVRECARIGLEHDSRR